MQFPLLKASQQVGKSAKKRVTEGRLAGERPAVNLRSLPTFFIERAFAECYWFLLSADSLTC
jgi:hypothetical protein